MKNSLAEVRQILSTALGSASESPSIIEEIHEFILDYFKDDSIIQHYDHNPDRYHAIVAAVTLQKIPSTPAPTPRGSTELPQTPPQDSHRKSERVEGGGRPYQACYEDTDGSILDQTASDALPVVTPEDYALADADGGPEDSTPQREGRLSRQAAHVAATLISQQLDTPNYRPRKRKHSPELSDASNPALTTTSDTAVAGGDCLGPDVSSLRESPPLPGPHDDSRDKQLYLSGSDRDYISIGPAPSSPNPPETTRSPAPSSDEGPSPLSDSLPAEFADLKEALQTEGRMIGNKETVERLWYLFNYMRATGTSQAGAGSELFLGSSPTSCTDQRNRVLGTYITREERNQGRLRLAKSLSGLRKRLYLVELIGNYLDEHKAWEDWKALPRRKRRKMHRPQSPLSRYTDVLFPETEGWKDARPGDNKAAEAARAVLREQAKKTLEYWISLGRPLVMLARRNGIGILGVLPKKMTDRILHDIRVNELDIFVDYVTFLHPDLERRLHILSGLLPRILQNGLPPGELVIETYTADQLGELHDRSLNELFQLATIEKPREDNTGMETEEDQMNTAGSSGLPKAGFTVDGEVPPGYMLQSAPQPPEEIDGQPDPFTTEPVELQRAESPAITIRSGEWRPMDPMESIAGRSSLPLAEPLSEMPMCDTLITDTALEDISMDTYPHHSPSQSTLRAVLPGTRLMPMVEPSSGTNCMVWDSGGRVESRFHHLEQSSDLGGVCLSSRVASPTILPSPHTTPDNAFSQEVRFPYSAPFFEDARCPGDLLDASYCTT